MSKKELVDAYLEGMISRRVFIKRLVAAGVSLAAASTFASVLGPGTALAARDTGKKYEGKDSDDQGEDEDGDGKDSDDQGEDEDGDGKDSGDDPDGKDVGAIGAFDEDFYEEFEA